MAAIDVIIKHVQRQLNERHLTLRPDLGCNISIESKNFTILDQTPQLRLLHTIIRDKTTSRSDFIFYIERLSRMVIEEGLNQLPYESVTILTPTKSTFEGKKHNAKVI